MPFPRTRKEKHPPNRYRSASTVLLLIILAAALACAAWGFHFHRPQEEASALELTVRYSDVEVFASRAGMTVPETLRFLQRHGVASIGVAEYTLWRLRRDRDAYVLSNLELSGELSLNPDLAPYRRFLENTAREEGLRFGDYVVFMPAGPWAEQVWQQLQELYEVEAPDIFALERFSYEDMALFIIRGARYDFLPGLSLGAKPARLEKVQEAGLLVKPYLGQREIDSAAAAELALSSFDGYPLSAVVFEGGTVPGHNRFIENTARALEKRGLPAVIYEYHQFPRGMPRLASLLDYRLAVMRPGSPEDPPGAVLNSIRERKVQVLELKIRDFQPLQRGEELREQLAARLNNLTAQLQEEGYSAAGITPMAPPSVPALFYLLPAAGLVGGALLLLKSFLRCRNRTLVVLLFLGTALCAALLRWNFLLAQQALALLTALLFPLYGALAFFLLPHQPAGAGPAGAGKENGAAGEEAGGAGASAAAHFSPPPPSPGSDPSPPSSASTLGPSPAGAGGSLFPEPRSEVKLLSRCYLYLLCAFLWSLAGGLIVHGFLSSAPFFHGLELFRGVKLMYVLPLAAAALLAVVLQGFAESGEGTTEGRYEGRRCDRGGTEKELLPAWPGGEGENGFAPYLRRLLRRPLSLAEMMLLGLLLLGAGFYLTRTGHVLEITAAEDFLRGFLERAFGVRPRFKEFLLGYPLAFLGLYLKGLPFSGKNTRRFAALLVAAGTLASISVVNTFAHITAPVELSLWRSVHGFWLGCIFGAVLYLVWKKASLVLMLHRIYAAVKKEEKRPPAKKEHAQSESEAEERGPRSKRGAQNGEGEGGTRT